MLAKSVNFENIENPNLLNNCINDIKVDISRYMLYEVLKFTTFNLQPSFLRELNI